MLVLALLLPLSSLSQDDPAAVAGVAEAAAPSQPGAAPAQAARPALTLTWRGLDAALVDRAETRLRRPEAEMQSLMEEVRNSRVAAEGVREAAEDRLQELEQERDASIRSAAIWL